MSIYRVVLTEKEKVKEVSPEQFIDFLSDLQFEREKERVVEVGLRIYELGEGAPPTSEIGKVCGTGRRYVLVTPE